MFTHKAGAKIHKILTCTLIRFQHAAGIVKGLDMCAKTAGFSNLKRPRPQQGRMEIQGAKEKCGEVCGQEGGAGEMVRVEEVDKKCFSMLAGPK